MSYAGPATNGSDRAAEAIKSRLLDRATEIIHRPDFSGYNNEVNRLGLHDNETRGKVVSELLKDQGSIPEHLRQPAALDAHLLDAHLASQREALKAQQAVLQEGAAAKEKGNWLTNSLTTVKNGFAAVGGHLWRNKWTYLTLAAVIGAGWYFSGYITPYLQQLRSAITQGAIDTAGAAGTEVAPTFTPALEAASEGGLLNGQALHEIPYIQNLGPIGPRSLVQPLAAPVNPMSVADPSGVLSAFPGGK